MGTILLNILAFAAGLGLIIKGADVMTDGASAIAKRFGISTLVIGMTIVAIGSSAPEFVVSAMSAFQGNTDMAIGNVVGSNIFNILCIMGATALVAPVAASKGNIRNDVPFVLLSSLAVAIACLDSYLGDGDTCMISRSEGLLMLCLFAVFISYTLAIAKKGCGSPTVSDDTSQAREDTSNVEVAKEKIKGADIKTDMPIWKCLLYVVGGLAMLIGGGNWLVDGASGIASSMGVSQSIIALTIVSMGTSAPELAASIMAARKGDTAMALGNIVGSVVFNVFFVLGASATICPLTIGNITLVDIGTLLFASSLLWLFCKSHSALVRWEGVILLAVQILYYIYLVINEQATH